MKTCRRAKQNADYFQDSLKDYIYVHATNNDGLDATVSGGSNVTLSNYSSSGGGGGQPGGGGGPR